MLLLRFDLFWNSRDVLLCDLMPLRLAATPNFSDFVEAALIVWRPVFVELVAELETELELETGLELETELVEALGLRPLPLLPSVSFSDRRLRRDPVELALGLRPPPLRTASLPADFVPCVDSVLSSVSFSDRRLRRRWTMDVFRLDCSLRSDV